MRSTGTEIEKRNETRENCCEPALTPRTDIAEYDDRFEIEVELPGVAPEKVDLQVEEDELRLSAERPGLAGDTKGLDYMLRERRPGVYCRTFQLGSQADSNGIQGQMTDGVLRIRIPKAVHCLPRRITIQS